MAEYVISGLREVSLALDGLPEKLQRKALANALRAGGRVVRDAARARVPVKSGALKRSIRVTLVRRGPALIARVVAGRTKKKGDPFYAWMVEGGTRPHDIRPKGKKSLFLAGLFKEEVRHPGSKPKPYLGPALEAGAQAALDAVRDTLAAEIEKLGKLA